MHSGGVTMLCEMHSSGTWVASSCKSESFLNDRFKAEL